MVRILPFFLPTLFFKKLIPQLYIEAVVTIL